jgi:molybdenum cofactor cytidylyltransferase
MGCAKVAGVLLAAGRGTRFGGNKLEAMLGGRMLGLHAAQTLAELGCGYRFAVHDPRNAALATALSGEGFALIDNQTPEAGLSHSLALAARAAQATAAELLLVCLADMPFVTADHLRAVIDAGVDNVVTSAVGDAHMPPALFPRNLWATLAELTGDQGARALLRGAIAVGGTAAILADIDTRADLNRSS